MVLAVEVLVSGVQDLARVKSPNEAQLAGLASRANETIRGLSGAAASAPLAALCSHLHTFTAQLATHVLDAQLQALGGPGGDWSAAGLKPRHDPAVPHAFRVPLWPGKGRVAADPGPPAGASPPPSSSSSSSSFGATPTAPPPTLPYIEVGVDSAAPGGPTPVAVLWDVDPSQLPGSGVGDGGGAPNESVSRTRALLDLKFDALSASEVVLQVGDGVPTLAHSPGSRASHRP